MLCQPVVQSLGLFQVLGIGPIVIHIEVVASPLDQILAAPTASTRSHDVIDVVLAIGCRLRRCRRSSCNSSITLKSQTLQITVHHIQGKVEDTRSWSWSSCRTSRASRA